MTSHHNPVEYTKEYKKQAAKARGEREAKERAAKGARKRADLMRLARGKP